VLCDGGPGLSACCVALRAPLKLPTVLICQINCPDSDSTQGWVLS
jgi:hypothetical protein